MDKEDLKTNKFLTGLLVTALILIAFFAGVYLNHFGLEMPPADDKVMGTWGTFGDYFGGILNPILGFCSFMALLFTIDLQNKQLKKTDEQLEQNRIALDQNAEALKLNNQELQNSNEQLSLSAKAQTEMERIQRKQQFEALFTYMANELSKIYDALRETLEKYHEDLNQLRQSFQNRQQPKVEWIFSDIGGYLNESPERIEREKIVKKFKSEYKSLKLLIYLYEILKFIDSNESLHENDKFFYSNLIRSSIENDVLQLIFLNCCYLEGFEEEFQSYKNLITRFSFFEYMTFSNKKDEFLESFAYLASLYDKNAFGKSNYYKEILIKLLKNKNLNYCKLEANINNNRAIVQIENGLVEFSNFDNTGMRKFFLLENFEIIGRHIETSGNSDVLKFKFLTFKVRGDDDLDLYLKVPANRFESFEVYLTDKENRYQFTKIENLPNMDTP